jgi:K+-transporting ATPase ATPase C chain
LIIGPDRLRGILSEGLAMLRVALILLVLMTIITGVAYPLAMTGLAKGLFPRQAAGSLVQRGGRTVGSELIGQSFTDPRYFWGRPSATSAAPYDAASSTGSNLGPANPALATAVKSRLDALHAADPGNGQAVPVDLVTASGSGLDPDISVAAARYQIARVARIRGIDETAVRTLVDAQRTGRQFGVLGEPRVNVLKLNMALDDRYPGPPRVPPGGEGRVK